MQLDYASILRAGQGLVPNLREQMMQDQQAQMQREAFDMQREQFRVAQEQAQRQQQRQAEYQGELERAMASGDPRAILNLRMRYPEFAKDMKDGYDALDADRKRTDLTQLGAIFSRAQAGDFEGAAKILEARVKADRDAGEPDARGEAILEALRSGSDIDRRVALGEVSMILAAVEPDKFGETLGKLNPTEATTNVQREYDWRVRSFGKAAADSWLATQDTKLVPVQPGGQVFAYGPNGTPATAPTAQGGGDPAAFGGVPAPQVGANGMPATLTQDQYRVTVERMGKAATDAWMQRNGITVAGQSSSAPVRVRSKQQYDRLPAGTPYIAPDGSQRVKS